jgi:hypothetical protein
VTNIPDFSLDPEDGMNIQSQNAGHEPKKKTLGNNPKVIITRSRT